jgi:hypothetical protein
VNAPLRHVYAKKRRRSRPIFPAAGKRIPDRHGGAETGLGQNRIDNPTVIDYPFKGMQAGRLIAEEYREYAFHDVRLYHHA